MKKWIAALLVLLLLAVPVAAEGYYVLDDSGLMESHDVEKLESIYAQYPTDHGFTPFLVTTDSFGGLTAAEFAASYYDMMDYPEDGILLLVSLEEGEWYILTNGECYRRISDEDATAIGKEVAEMIPDKAYYAAFLKFPQLAAEVYKANEPVEEIWEEAVIFQEEAPSRNYGKTIAICMIVGMAIGGITVGIMAYRMKTVRQQSGASDYVRPGSMQLTQSRDIFLYSRVSRTAKPKNNSSSGGHSSGGGSRGGAGGRL